MKPRFIICMGVLLSGGCWFFCQLLSRDDVPLRVYNQISVGMTQVQVQNFMGAPEGDFPLNTDVVGLGR